MPILKSSVVTSCVHLESLKIIFNIWEEKCDYLIILLFKQFDILIYITCTYKMIAFRERELYAYIYVGRAPTA